MERHLHIKMEINMKSFYVGGVLMLALPFNTAPFSADEALQRNEKMFWSKKNKKELEGEMEV